MNDEMPRAVSSSRRTSAGFDSSHLPTCFSSILALPTTIMSQSPKEQLERLQAMLQRTGGRGGFGMPMRPSGGGPGAGAVAALFAVGLAGYAISNSFFNGMICLCL